MSNRDRLRSIEDKIAALKDAEYVESFIMDPKKQDLFKQLEDTIEELGKLYE